MGSHFGLQTITIIFLDFFELLYLCVVPSVFQVAYRTKLRQNMPK